MVEEVESQAWGGVLRDPQGRVCLVRPAGRGLWALPKGHPEAGEEPAAAALREVLEETGAAVVLGPYLGSVTYTYPARQGTRTLSVRKTVGFFAMTLAGPPGAGPSDQDEIESVGWFPLPEAIAALGYPSERALLEAVGGGAP